MHFSIPDTQEFTDGAGNAYIGYNIHINGLFHCTVRYKQLHNLHVQLSKDLDMALPIFPPKKLFPLTPTQQEERRLALEKYIQCIGQNAIISNSEILNGFLLNAQLESADGFSEKEIINIFLMNGSKILLNISPGEHSGKILKKIYKHIQLPEKYYFHFALFIIVQDELSGDIKILRKLQEFESPFITYKYINTIGSRIVLRKNYWDMTYDIELLNDPVTLNLLYIQAAAEIRSSWISVTKEVQHQLEILEKSGNIKEYLNVARQLKYYGYMLFAPCYCDYPERNSKVLLAIGGNELNLRVLSPEEHEIVFKVSRMRCWRITTIQNGTDYHEDDNEYNLELSFEYLIARNELQWITIVSEQAILMSVCLQAMIDELLQKCVAGNRSQVESGKSWTYIMRDGQSRIITGSPLHECTNNNHSKSGPIIKKLVNKLTVTKKSNDSKVNADNIQTADHDIMENNVFRMIGDDDL